MRFSLQRLCTQACGAILAGVTALGAPSLAFATGSGPGAGPLKVFLNADLTHAHAVGQSLRIGLQAGLAVGAARFDTPPIRVEARDHRNNMRRTERLIEEASQDPATLALIGGMHTPHYLRYGPDINAADLVMLLPWSAGATLTRLADGEENHIFRVSVDDRKAAPFLANSAIDRGCTRIAALAMDNGWGSANVAGLERALSAHDGVDLIHKVFVRRDAGEHTMAFEIERIREKNADCVVMVFSANGSALATNIFAQWDSPPNIFSHWGIMGGRFAEIATPEAIARTEITVLSTCLLEVVGSRKAQLAEALGAASLIESSIRSLEDIPLPMAFAHAFDAGLILSAATTQASASKGWDGDRRQRAALLRAALEDLQTPVEGLLKTYTTPFGPMGHSSPDGHEALGHSDLCLSRKTQTGRLVAVDHEARL